MNCCNCICSTYDPCKGAKGATGPRGPSGLNRIADFYNLNTEEIGNDVAITLLNNVNFDAEDIIHTSGTADVTLATGGYYLITYDADAFRTASGIVGLKITADGSNVAISLSSAFATAGLPTHLSTSFIYNNTMTNTIINLRNNSGSGATFENVNLVIQKLSV
ncbi:MAG: hypothetical protein EOM55_00195 [Clostridia bacterium]|nr:hypothetical protein [Clostridia bacterium]